MTGASGILCVYILPGADNPQADAFKTYAERFAGSYAQFPAGLPHDLLVVVKGNFYGGGFERQFGDRAIFCTHPDSGYDIGALLRIANERPDYEFLMLLGAYSRILSENWLAKLYLVGQVEDIGVVGVTASFESGVSRMTPNPHIRTPTFMISPRLLLSVGERIQDKWDTYEFEHGTRSLYRQLTERGLRCPIVGADGKAYFEAEWADSHTFRRGEQLNLLIADKQSDAFAAAAPLEREALARAAGWEPQ